MLNKDSITDTMHAERGADHFKDLGLNFFKAKSTQSLKLRVRFLQWVPIWLLWFPLPVKHTTEIQLTCC